MSQNRLFYKERPFIYAVIGVVGLLYSRYSKLALVSGLVLLICSGLIFYVRKMNKERNDDAQLQHDELSSQIKSKSEDKITIK